MNALFMPQSSYCSLVKMSHRRIKKKKKKIRKINNMINRLNDRCLRTIFDDKYSTFEKLLEKDNFVTPWYTQTKFSVIRGISASIINKLLERNEGNNYNLRNTYDLPIVKTVFSELETLSYFGSKLWEIAPPEIKVVVGSLSRI